MKGKILVFEDLDKSYDELKKGFKKAGETTLLDRFNSKSIGPVKSQELDRMFGSRSSTRLVVLDQDLSRYGRYISSAEIKEACLRNGIPLCVYATKNEEYRVKEYMSWSEAQIALDSRDTMEDLAKKCLTIYEGFSLLQGAFKKAGSRKGDARGILHDVLKAPAVASAQIQQYAWGDRQILARVNKNIHSRYVATMTGYWVFNVLLRFPGVMLNEIAAASYLGISTTSFEDPAVRKLFSAAKYSGPFAGLGQFWWAAELDKLVAGVGGDQNYRGWNYACKNGLKVGKVKCAEKGHAGAGYYCIVTGKPVCLQHSDSPSGWLPLGAERSRISRSKYRQLAPWLGI